MSQTEIPGGDELSTEEMRFAREDHLVRCNSCGFTRRKSDPGGCPGRHVSGWSYAGPIEGEVVPVAEAVTEFPTNAGPYEMEVSLRSDPDVPIRDLYEMVADPVPDEDVEPIARFSEDGEIEVLYSGPMPEFLRNPDLPDGPEGVGP